jgi:hypothetical protein
MEGYKKYFEYLLFYYYYILNLLMVKLVQKGSQDPTDSSLQMKVITSFMADQTILGYGTQITHRSRTKPKSLCY